MNHGMNMDKLLQDVIHSMDASICFLIHGVSPGSFFVGHPLSGNIPDSKWGYGMMIVQLYTQHQYETSETYDYVCI